MADVTEPLVSETDIAAQAHEAASRAARQAGISIRPLERMADHEAASRLAALVWNDDGPAKAPAELLRALAHAGNYVVGGFVDDALVAMSVAFYGLNGGPLKLHSHITGVHPDLQGRAVGYAVKQHQRAWALARGIDAIEWTTDPLVRRNGFFNLQKLGAEMTAYHVDFYGPMADGLNAGDETDRVVVRWALRAPRAVAASEGGLDEPAYDASAGEVLDADGTVGHVPETGSLRAWVPPDIVRMRAEDRDRAHRWRIALRLSLGRAIEEGFRAHAMTRDGWYFLSR